MKLFFEEKTLSITKFLVKVKSIGSKIALKSNGGRSHVNQRGREGFHRICSYDDSLSEYAPLIG